MKTKNIKHIVLSVLLFSSLGNAHAFDFSSAKELLKNATDIAKQNINTANEYIQAENEKGSTETGPKKGLFTNLGEMAKQNLTKASDFIKEQSAKNAQSSQLAPIVEARPSYAKKTNTEINNSAFDISLNIPADTKWIMYVISKGNFKETISEVATTGAYDKRLFLKDGDGAYEINVYTSKVLSKYDNGYTFLTKTKVTNLDDRDMSYALPSEMVQSENEKIVELAHKLTEGSGSDEESLLKIHDYIVKTVKYDYESYYDGTYVNKSFDAVSVLENRLTVCSGYSNLLAALARAAGIKAKIIIGQGLQVDGSTGPHAWNEVLVNGEWKIIDVTWDTNRNDSKYFLIDENLFAKDHVREKELTNF